MTMETSSVKISSLCIPEMALEIYNAIFSQMLNAQWRTSQDQLFQILTPFLETPAISFILYLILNFQLKSPLEYDHVFFTVQCFKSCIKSC